MQIRKTNNSRIILLAFFVITLLLTFSSAEADGRKGIDRKEKREEVISKMSLTPKQKNEIIETQEIQKHQLGKIRRALKDRRSDLADELKKDKLNFDDIKEITDDIKDLQGQLIDNRISHFIRLKKILTKEQMNELLDSYEEKR